RFYVVQPSLFESLLWLADPALRLFLLAVLWRRKLIRPFPLFTAYTVFWIAAFSVQYSLHRMELYKAYHIAYWTCSAASGLISFIVICDLLIKKVRGNQHIYRKYL